MKLDTWIASQASMRRLRPSGLQAGQVWWEHNLNSRPMGHLVAFPAATVVVRELCWAGGRWYIIVLNAADPLNSADYWRDVRWFLANAEYVGESGLTDADLTCFY